MYTWRIKRWKWMTWENYVRFIVRKKMRLVYCPAKRVWFFRYPHTAAPRIEFFRGLTIKPSIINFLAQFQNLIKNIRYELSARAWGYRATYIFVWCAVFWQSIYRKYWMEKPSRDVTQQQQQQHQILEIHTNEA